ncbi:hypothetical protein [Nocardia abscessus]|nr:hypothetical protein [Nocardia abscessus]
MAEGNLLGLLCVESRLTTSGLFRRYSLLRVTGVAWGGCNG